jgi:hypothetical protein
MIDNPVFKGVLLVVQMADEAKDYKRREKALIEALALALNMGMPAGIRVDPKEPGWPVIFFELPTGQISWHVKQHELEWDGHSTELKNERVRKYVNGER